MGGSEAAESGAEVDHPSVQWAWAARERGLWVECHTKEFCMKVLKFEIVNSQKSFNYFSRVVPKTIEFVHPVMLFPGRFKNGPFKNREDDTRSLSQN